MTDFKSFRTNLEEKKGLWDNIHAKRKRGEKPNPPGHPDRPTAQDFKDAQKKESVEEKKTANEAKDGDGANIVRDREFKGKKLSSQPRAKPGDKGFNSYDKLFKKGGQKPAWMDREKMKKESVEEKKLTAAELKKREEIAKAMERDNPGMDMSKKMAIATATAKRVAEQSLDEKVYASDYNVGAEKSQFGGYTPVVTHKKTGRTMYSAQHSYKKPEHAKGHASAYLNGYQAMGDRHADRKAREYATQNQKHQYVKESLDISEISLDMLTKKISNSGMDTTKKANKMDKTKNDLAALKARLAGKPAMAKEAYEDDEPASPDEASMAMRQLGFIEYAAEEVMDHIKSGKEFPEWMQNKLSKLHGQMESLHSALGEHGEDDEEMKEATELDELNKKTLGSYVKKASRDVANRSADNARDVAKNGAKPGLNKKTMKNWRREIGIDMAIDKMTKEATELDELNKKTLGSYIKKASGSAAGVSAVTSAQAAIKGKSNPDDRRQLRNRLTGISRATDKVTKEEVANEALSNNMRLISKIKNSGVVKTGSMAKDTKPAPKKEGVNTADKKPEKFVKPDGTVGIRMVPVDKQIVDKDK